MTKLIRLPEVICRTGLKRSSIYTAIQAGTFPPQVALGRRAVGWPKHEVTALNAARIAGKTEEAIRALVTELEAERKTFGLRLLQKGGA